MLNPTECDVVEKVRSLTGGFGCDVYIEATGHPQSVKQGQVKIATCITQTAVCILWCVDSVSKGYKDGCWAVCVL